MKALRGRRVLVLAGVSEADAIADQLRTRFGASPLLAIDAAAARRSGELDPERRRRVETRGPVQGAEGLLTALKWDRVAAVIDASHPFDGDTPRAAATACRALGLPLAQFVRPGWSAAAERRVESLEAALSALPFFARAFFWIGAGGLARIGVRRDLWSLARTLQPPAARYPGARGDFAAGAPPFTEAHERALLDAYRISHLCLENTGAAFGAPLLSAAERLERAVILIEPPERPPPPPGGSRSESVEDLLAGFR